MPATEARPYDFTFDPTRLALLIIDMQLVTARPFTRPPSLSKPVTEQSLEIRMRHDTRRYVRYTRQTRCAGPIRFPRHFSVWVKRTPFSARPSPDAGKPNPAPSRPAALGR
jgi:hypothetical protein